MLPYTAKFYSNGTIYDSVGDSTQHYVATYRESDVMYYLRNQNQVESYNINSEYTSAQTATTKPGVSARSIVVVDGLAYGFEGYSAKLFDTTSVLYILNNAIYHETLDFTYSKMLLSSTTYVRDFFVDSSQNYYVLHGRQSLTMFNKDRVINYSIKISASAAAFANVVSLTSDPELVAIDKVREYTNTGLKEYPIVIGRINTSQMFMAKVDETAGALYNVVLLPISGTWYPHDDQRHVNYNLTNYTFIQNKYNNRQHELLFKLSLKNIYNNRDIQQIEMPVDTSKFTTGYHHFAFRLNTAQGVVSLFVDGREHTSTKIPPVNYTFQDITQDSMCVGATYFYNNIPLFDKLKQPNYYMINNCKIKQLKIYDKAITDDQIRLLVYKNTKIDDLMLSLPCGQRNEIDQIERIFSFNVPGNRSNYVNIIVKDSTISNSQLQDRVREVLTEKLQKVLPVATKINSIIFRDNQQTYNKRIT